VLIPSFPSSSQQRADYENRDLKGAEAKDDQKNADRARDQKQDERDEAEIAAALMADQEEYL
jgi:hypothetical protein